MFILQETEASFVLCKVNITLFVSKIDFHEFWLSLNFFQILVVIEPLLIDEDYYARVEGREIISNLAKVIYLN